MTTQTQNGFMPIEQYKAPTQTNKAGPAGNYNFFTPSDTQLPTGSALTGFLAPPGSTEGQVQNRTVKYDGALTREQVGNVGEALSGQIGTVNTNLQNGVNGLGTAITTGFTDTNKNLGTVNDGIKTGFAGIGNTLATQGTAMDKIGSNLTTYFNSLNAGQDAAKAQVGALQTGFDSFNNQYGKDVVRADQSRTDLQKSLTGGFNTLTQDMNAQNDVASRERNNIMNAVAGGSAPSTGGGAQMQPGGFAGPTAQAGGQAPQAGPNGQPTPIMQQADMARQIASTMSANLPPQVFNQIASFATSFDASGALIPRTINPDGSFVTRQPTPDGNISITGVDVMGNVKSGLLNINQTAAMMAQISNSPFRQ